MTIENKDTRERQQLALCYQIALKAGDFEVVQSVLALAEQDSELETLILTVNENRLITLQSDLTQPSTGNLATTDDINHKNRRGSHRTFWTVAAASLLTALLGIVLVMSRIPRLQTLVIAPAPVLSFTEHGLITSENIDQLQPFARLGNGRITEMHILPDGEHLLIAATTGLYLHDAQDLSAEPQQIYAGILGGYSDVDDNGYFYGTDESLNLSQAGSITVSRWDTITGERTDFLHLNDVPPIALRGLQVKPDGSQVLMDLCREFEMIGNFGNRCQQRAYVWHDTATGEQLYTLDVSVGNAWGGFAMSDDWSTFAYAVDVAYSDRLNQPMIKFMDMATYETKTVITFGAPQSIEGGTVWGLGEFTFSPDSQYLLVQPANMEQTSSVIYDVDSLWEVAEPLNVSTNADAVRYRTVTLGNSYLTPAFTADSRTLITLSETQAFRYTLTDDEQLLRLTFKGNLMSSEPSPIADGPILSPDASTLYIHFAGNIVMAYNVETLNKVDEMAYYQNDYSQNFQFTSDGSKVVIHAGNYGETIPDIWTINTDPPIHETFSPDGNLTAVNQFALSPDGTQVAYQVKNPWMMRSNPLWVQDISNQTPAFKLAVNPSLSSLQFLQDGSLVGMNIHSTLLRWSGADITSDSPELRAHEVFLPNLRNTYDYTRAKYTAIDPGGQWFAAAICLYDMQCASTRFKLWDIENNQQVLTVADDDTFKRVGTLAFSPDSQFLAIGYCREMREVVDMMGMCTASEVRFYTMESLLNHVNLHDAPPPEPQFTLTGFTELPTNIEFNPIQQIDGSWLVAITEWNTRTQLWSIYPDGTSEVLRILDSVRQPVAFDPTGALMFTTSDTAQTEVWGAPLIETTSP